MAKEGTRTFAVYLGQDDVDIEEIDVNAYGDTSGEIDVTSWSVENLSGGFYSVEAELENETGYITVSSSVSGAECVALNYEAEKYSQENIYNELQDIIYRFLNSQAITDDRKDYSKYVFFVKEKADWLKQVSIPSSFTTNASGWSGWEAYGYAGNTASMTPSITADVTYKGSNILEIAVSDDQTNTLVADGKSKTIYYSDVRGVDSAGRTRVTNTIEWIVERGM